MKLWTSLSPTNEDKRWQALSKMLTDAGQPNEFTTWEGTADSLDDLAALDKFHHVRISSRFGPQVLKNLKVQSSWTTLLGVIDGMVKQGDTWWPLCALYEGMGSLLFQLGKDQLLDTRGSVLVAGVGGTARIAIAAFFKAGFRNFLMTNFNEEEAQVSMREVQASFFGLSLQWVPMQKIVMLPGESSVLVNCTPSVEENALLIELSYMNFLKRPGILFDVSRSRKPSILMQEALDAGVKVVGGLEIAARADILWAKWAFGVDLSLEEYLKALEAAID